MDWDPSLTGLSAQQGPGEKVATGIYPANSDSDLFTKEKISNQSDSAFKWVCCVLLTAQRRKLLSWGRQDRCEQTRWGEGRQEPAIRCRPDFPMLQDEVWFQSH